MPDRGPQASDRGRDHRRAARLGFHGHQPERLRVRRHHDHGRGTVPVGQLALGARRLQPDQAGDTEVMSQLDQAVRVGPPGPARATNEREGQRPGQRRVVPDQLRGGPQHQIGCLERLHPAREHHHGPVGGQAEPAPRLSGRAGPEHREIHSRVHRPDLGRVRPVEPHQLECFLLGVGDQAVRGGHDLRLTAQPHLRLGRVTPGQGRVLDQAQRVHGLHQGDPPALPGHQPDLAGEPVVRVHEVVPAGVVRGLGAQHLERELAELRGQVGLVQLLERAGRHVPDQHAGNQLSDGWRIRRDGPGEDLDLHPAAGQAFRDLHHVHVQAPGVTGAWLFERRGMDTDGRDPPGEASRHGHAPPD